MHAVVPVLNKMKYLKFAINIIRKSTNNVRQMSAFQQHHTLYTSAYHFHPRFQTPENPEKQTDVEILEQIEQNLFENPNNQVVNLKKEQILEFASKSSKSQPKASNTKQKQKSEDETSKASNELLFDEKLGLHYKQFDRHDKRLG
jgi:hypothetical protein